jgi:hypothetical protein
LKKVSILMLLLLLLLLLLPTMLDRFLQLIHLDALYRPNSPENLGILRLRLERDRTVRPCTWEEIRSVDSLRLGSTEKKIDLLPNVTFSRGVWRSISRVQRVANASPPQMCAPHQCGGQQVRLTRIATALRSSLVLVNPDPGLPLSLVTIPETGPLCLPRNHGRDPPHPNAPCPLTKKLNMVTLLLRASVPL